MKLPGLREEKRRQKVETMETGIRVATEKLKCFRCKLELDPTLEWMTQKLTLVIYHIDCNKNLATFRVSSVAEYHEAETQRGKNVKWD